MILYEYLKLKLLHIIMYVYMHGYMYMCITRIKNYMFNKT